MMTEHVVRRMREQDIAEVVRINNLVFSKKKDPEEWVEGNFRHFPRMQYFVADSGTILVGFILWVEKSGHRPKPVVELEAMAVDPAYKGNGIGCNLVRESFARLNEHYLQDRGNGIERVLISTGEDNLAAQGLYAKALRAIVEAMIPELYSGKNEVTMVARAGNGVI